jgi:hypothetical protein
MRTGSKDEDRQLKEYKAEVVRLARCLIDACKQADCGDPFLAIDALHAATRNRLWVVFGKEADSIYARHISAAGEELRPIFDAVLVERGGHTHGGGDDLSRCPLCNPILVN